MAYKNVEDRRAYHKQYMKERREWLKSNHFCVQCSKQDAYTLNGRSLCFECNEKENERKKLQYVSKSRQEYSKKKIDECHENGICVKCKTRKVADGRKQCGVCLAKDRIRWRKNHNDSIPRSDRWKYDLCYKCGNPLDGQMNTDGTKSKLCTACYSVCPKPPKTRVLHTPFCHTENAMRNWEKVLEKRKELLENGTYDYIPIVNIIPHIKAGAYSG